MEKNGWMGKKIRQSNKKMYNVWYVKVQIHCEILHKNEKSRWTESSYEFCNAMNFHPEKIVVLLKNSFRSGIFPKKSMFLAFSAREMPANWRFGWKFIKFNNKQHTKLVFQWVRLSNTSSWDNCFWKHIRRKEIKGVKWKMKKPRNSFMLQLSTHVKGSESFTFRLYIQFPMPVWNQ